MGRLAPLGTMSSRRSATRSELEDEPSPCSLFASRPKQVSPVRDRTLQPLQEFRIDLDPLQQSRQRRRVFDRKIARIVAAKEPNRAVDARRQDRNSGSDSFGY